MWIQTLHHLLAIVMEVKGTLRHLIVLCRTIPVLNIFHDVIRYSCARVGCKVIFITTNIAYEAHQSNE